MKQTSLFASFSMIFKLVLLGPILADSPSAAAAPHHAARRISGSPGVRKLGSISNFWLQRYRADNTRYLANADLRFSAATPRIYDAQTRKVSFLPFLNRLSKRWYRTRLVYYDAARGIAGLWVHKSPSMGIKEPTCKCGGKSVPLPGSLMRYCPCSGEIIRISLKLRKDLDYRYVHVDLKTQRILWTVRLGAANMAGLGVDSAGKHFMAYRIHHRTTGGRTVQRVELIRVSFNDRKIDWTYSVQMPTRTGLQFPGLAKVKLVASSDLRKVFIHEYDERDRSHPKGYLTSPPAQGVIVDVASSSHVTFKVPVTSYGAVFDRMNRFLYVSSHQLGRIYKFDARSGRLEKSVYQGYGAFFLILSKTGRYLYCIHMHGINAFDPVTLKRVRSIRLSQIFPGHRKFLSVPTLLALDSGDFFMGLLKKTRSGMSSYTEQGPVLLHLRVTE